jgi:starch phosphorylase
VRILFAGKAHPNDGAGQDLLRKVVAATRSPELLGKVYFLDDYDMDLARRLVQGVDVWLNTPVRGMEASGTSGMKAVANGALHASVRDGWWDEGYDGSNGWAVGDGPMAGTREVEDDLDAAALVRLLEDEIVPAFFDRGPDGLPLRWLERMRRSLSTLPPVFDARRQVLEYGALAYWPLSVAGVGLSTDGFAGARSVAARHARVRRAFAGVRVRSFRIDGLEGLVAGNRIEVAAEVDLSGLDPSDVVVELVFRGGGDTPSRVGAVLEPGGEPSGGARPYRGGTTVLSAGRLSGAVRVRARADSLEDAPLRDLVVWA